MYTFVAIILRIFAVAVFAAILYAFYYFASMIDPTFATIATMLLGVLLFFR